MTFPPGTDLHTITQACWDFFEPFIRARPELWLWNYKHWRYRPREAPPDGYPFYAHWSDRFEEVLRKAEGGMRKAERRRPEAEGEEWVA